MNQQVFYCVNGCSRLRASTPHTIYWSPAFGLYLHQKFSRSISDVHLNSVDHVTDLASYWKMPTNGITISILAETNAGRHRYMEDYVDVHTRPNDTMGNIPELREQIYIGVFDGHGGKEAAKYARDHMWAVIQAQPQNSFCRHRVCSSRDKTSL